VTVALPGAHVGADADRSGAPTRAPRSSTRSARASRARPCSTRCSSGGASAMRRPSASVSGGSTSGTARRRPTAGNSAPSCCPTASTTTPGKSSPTWTACGDTAIRVRSWSRRSRAVHWRGTTTEGSRGTWVRRRRRPSGQATCSGEAQSSTSPYGARSGGGCSRQADGRRGGTPARAGRPNGSGCSSSFGNLMAGFLMLSLALLRLTRPVVGGFGDWLFDRLFGSGPAGRAARDPPARPSPRSSGPGS
jgi:hypothetical protein